MHWLILMGARGEDLVEEIEVLAGCDGMRVTRHREVARAIAETLPLDADR